MAGRIFKRKARFWIAYYAPLRSRSVEVREPGGKTEAAARKLLDHRMKQIAAHEIGARRFVGPRGEKITVGQMLDEVEKDYKLRDRKWAKQTACHLRPIRNFFGDDRLADVSAAQMRAYIESRKKANIAPATINRELVGLKRALSMAVEEEILPTAPRVPHLREDNAREGFFSRPELDLVLAALPDQDLRDFAEWSFFSGMRPGESRSLTWSGFDRQSWTLRLHSSQAKTGYGRVIALEGSLREIIRRRLDARDFSCQLIFHRGGKRMNHSRPWRKACAAVGLAGRRLYDLRRTAVRNLVRAGVPERVAMEISGHRTRAIFDRYNVTDERDLRAAAIRVTEFVDQMPYADTVAVLKPNR